MCVNSIPRSFYSTRISLFVYYTFDFPPNWLATHVMSCPGCLVFVLLVVGALLKLVAGGQNSLIEPFFFIFFFFSFFNNYVAIYTVLKTRTDLSFFGYSSLAKLSFPSEEEKLCMTELYGRRWHGQKWHIQIEQPRGIQPIIMWFLGNLKWKIFVTHD